MNRLGSVIVLTFLAYAVSCVDAVSARSQEAGNSEITALSTEANAGNVQAEHDLADRYKLGKGVRQDYVEAIKWYLKAAGKGDIDSEVNLGFAYQAGYGVKKNEKTATEWFEKAAEQGNAQAQYFVGVAYLNGKGVKRAPVVAAHWLEKAADQGDGNAMSSLGAMRWLGQGMPRDLVLAYMWLTLSEKFGSVETTLNGEVPSLRHDLMRELDESEVSEGKAMAIEWLAKHPNLKPEKTN